MSRGLGDVYKRQVNYEEMEEKARAERPKLIIAGASAYSREWDYARIRKIADEIGAIFMVDMAHPAGLIAAGLLENPVKHAHVVTTTTHKTLRGPRGGLILMGKDFDNPWGKKTPKGEIKKMSAPSGFRCVPRRARRSVGARDRSKGCGFR